MPPKLKKLVNQVHLKNGTCEQIVSHLETELELNGMDAPDKLQINTVTQQTTQKIPKNPNQLVTTAKSLVTTETSAVKSNQMKTQPKTTQIVSAITAKKRGQTNSNSNKMIPNNTNANKANKRIDRKPRPIYAPCEICGKKTIP